MAYDPKRPLVFMHIPKTSGTALTAGLLEILRPQKPLTGFDRFMFGSFRDYQSFIPEVRQSIYDDPASLPRDADFIHGHFSISLTADRYPTSQFMTILREPRVRLLSLFYYWRSQTEATMRGWGTWPEVVARSRAPLEVFLSDHSVACQTDNMTLRMLVSPHPLVPVDGYIEPEHDEVLLQEARNRLDRFDYVNVVENPGVHGDLIEWLQRPLKYHRINETVTEGRLTGSRLGLELTDHALDRLEFCSRLDSQLWEKVFLDGRVGENVAKARERAILRAVANYA